MGVRRSGLQGLGVEGLGLQEVSDFYRAGS